MYFSNFIIHLELIHSQCLFYLYLLGTLSSHCFLSKCQKMSKSFCYFPGIEKLMYHHQEFPPHPILLGNFSSHSSFFRKMSKKLLLSPRDYDVDVSPSSITISSVSPGPLRFSLLFYAAIFLSPLGVAISSISSWHFILVSILIALLSQNVKNVQVLIALLSKNVKKVAAIFLGLKNWFISIRYIALNLHAEIKKNNLKIYRRWLHKQYFVNIWANMIWYFINVN